MQQDIDQIRLIVQRSMARSISIGVSADQDLQFIESPPIVIIVAIISITNISILIITTDTDIVLLMAILGYCKFWD